MGRTYLFRSRFTEGISREDVWEVDGAHVDLLGGWVSGWLSELFSYGWGGRGERGGSNELLGARGLGRWMEEEGGWVGGWVGGLSYQYVLGVVELGLDAIRVHRDVVEELVGELEFFLYVRQL